MSDDSKLNKEATNFAILTDNEKELDLVRLCWEACAAYIESQVRSQCGESFCLDAVRKIIDAN